MKQTLLLLIALSIPFLSLSQDTITHQKVIGGTISLPWANHYYYYDYDLQQKTWLTGFTGLGGSVFYKQDNHKFSLNFGITSDLPAPLGPIDYEKTGTRSAIATVPLEVIYHRKLFGKVNIIGGINHVWYKFRLISYEDSIPAYSVVDKSLGLTIGGEYLFRKKITFALFYRPTIIPFDRKQYRQLISMDVRFDLLKWKVK